MTEKEPDRPDKYLISEMAAQIKTFRGDRKPQEAIDYIRAVQPRFLGNNEDERLLLEFSVAGTAQSWLHNLKKRPEWSSMSGQDVIELIQATFIPASHADTALENLVNLKRGIEPLDWFLKKFMYLKQEVAEDSVSEACLCVYLFNGVGEPYANDLRRQALQGFTAQFEYLQRQADFLA